MKLQRYEIRALDDFGGRIHWQSNREGGWCSAVHVSELEAENVNLKAEIDALHAECDRLTSLLQYEEGRRTRIGTHGPDCWKWGPSHYECALRELNSKPKLLEAHDLTEPGWYWHKWPLQKEWQIVKVHHPEQAAGQFVGPLLAPEV